MNKLRLTTVALSALILSLLSSCSQSPTAPNQSSSDLIQNSNFEMNGKPSLNSWIYDTLLATVVRAGPDSESTWSLQLKSGWIPQQGFAQTYVSGQYGPGVYAVSVWVKADSGSVATLSFGRWSGGKWVSPDSVSSTVPQWLMMSIVDSLSPSASDSIAVCLSAGSTELTSRAVLFTDVTLQRLQ